MLSVRTGRIPQGGVVAGPDGRLKVKVTLSADQDPELFRELSRIPSGPKRAGRLLTLATIGEYAIRSGLAATTAQQANGLPSSSSAPGLTGSPSARPSDSPTFTIKDTLSWGDNDE